MLLLLSTASRQPPIIDYNQYVFACKRLSILAMEIQRQLGRNVRNARVAAGLSQWQLVAALEQHSGDNAIDQAYLSLLENGKKNPTLVTIWFIAQALGVTAAQLLDDHG